MKQISICLITYNKAPFLGISIPAIVHSLKYPESTEIIIIDNGSTDSTPKVIEELINRYYDYVKIFSLSLKENIGLNAYREAVFFARGEIIVTADDDIFHVSRDWEDYFERALYFSFDGRRIGYVGSDTVNKDGGRVRKPIGYASAEDLKVEIGSVGGWFAATTREAYDKIGGFHTGRPEMYLEDADYQRRAWDVGYLCGTALNVRVFHARDPYYYIQLGCRDTYVEKERLAGKLGFKLESIDGT